VIQGKHPVVKSNPHALTSRMCKHCGKEIYDLRDSKFAETFKDNLTGIILCSSISPFICKACAAEECPQNYKHEVVLKDGLHYCNQCKKVVETRSSYRDHMKENEIDVVAHITPVTGEINFRK